MSKGKKILIILFVILVLIAFYFLIGTVIKPIFTIPNGMTISNQNKTNIVIVEKGFYSPSIPLLARRIKLLEVNDDYILYKVLYFPFGSIKRSLTRENDNNWVFNLEKPLNLF